MHTYATALRTTPALTGAALLCEAFDRIREEPLSWNQATWFGRDMNVVENRDLDPKHLPEESKDHTNACGTTACLAGHCLLASQMWKQSVGRDRDNKVISVDFINVFGEAPDTTELDSDVLADLGYEDIDDEIDAGVVAAILLNIDKHVADRIFSGSLGNGYQSSVKQFINDVIHDIEQTYPRYFEGTRYAGVKDSGLPLLALASV